jgi:hypothetical protein
VLAVAMNSTCEIEGHAEVVVRERVVLGGIEHLE